MDAVCQNARFHANKTLSYVTNILMKNSSHVAKKWTKWKLNPSQQLNPPDCYKDPPFCQPFYQEPECDTKNMCEILLEKEETPNLDHLNQSHAPKDFSCNEKETHSDTSFPSILKSNTVDQSLHI